eukprot:2500596-Alexandrium_andersonii.AAC.1
MPHVQQVGLTVFCGRTPPGRGRNYGATVGRVAPQARDGLNPLSGARGACRGGTQLREEG